MGLLTWSELRSAEFLPLYSNHYGASVAQYIGVNYQEVGVAIHGVYLVASSSYLNLCVLNLFMKGPLIQDGALAYSGKVDSILVETEMPTELESFKEICLATDVLLGERISTSMMWNFASNCIAGSVGLKNNSPKPTQVASECSDDEVSSNISREEGLECPICFESFNIVENVPYVFMGSLKFPRKNYFLLWMLESMNGDREKSHSSFSGDHHQPVWSSDSNLALGSQVNHRILRREQFIHHSGPSGSNHEDGHVNNYLTLERLHSSLHKSLVFFVQLTAKFPLVVILLLIVLYAIPASAAILALYILITVLFALPSVLMLYFAYPSLDWLAREIIT
ncbi:hypothetical protein CK203_088832 [Vitis vinifera]|uniref:Uncharacterized protein n=1 Tax=Vitis vinifera TaxID=29760 RepID=A0A438D4M4_VITVI|nr:hypothetical protein CK203_088832 [Vitis vinifera]